MSNIFKSRYTISRYMSWLTRRVALLILGHHHIPVLIPLCGAGTVYLTFPLHPISRNFFTHYSLSQVLFRTTRPRFLYVAPFQYYHSLTSLPIQNKGEKTSRYNVVHSNLKLQARFSDLNKTKAKNINIAKIALFQNGS